MNKFFPVFLLLTMILFGFVTINGQTMNSERDPNSVFQSTTGGQGGVIIDGDGDWSTLASLPTGTSTSGSASAYLNGKVYLRLDGRFKDLQAKQNIVGLGRKVLMLSP